MKKHSKLKKLCKLLIFLICLGVQSIYAKDIYVSKNGNDANPGTSTKPYLTIQKASSVAQPGDVIIIGGGTYEEIIRPVRSGRAGAPITYASKPGEKVIITAMQALSGWQKDKGSIYKMKVNWDLGQENFILNGNTAMDLARWPDNTDGDPFTLNSKRSKGGSDGKTINAFLLSNELPKKVKNWKDGVVFFYGDRPGSGWIAWKAKITSGSSGKINFKLDKNPDWIRTFHPPKDGGDFYIEGLKDILDYKNEWWFDKNTKELFVFMEGGQAPANNKIKMRRRTLTVDLSNRSYIEVKNLAVLGGEIKMDNRSKNNRIYGVSSFYGNHTVGIQKGFSANKQSVLLEGKNNVVEKCEIAFGAANGIKIGGDNNKILNSRIHDFNYLGSYDAPINARGGKNSVFKGNTIFRGGRDGVQFFNNNSVFEYNDVSYSNLINDDCALIYTVGGPHNGEIHHNWFHDAESRGKLRKAAGIYLDNNAEAFSVHHNVVWNVEWTNIQINWNGKDINVFNNTFAKAKGGTMGFWRRKADPKKGRPNPDKLTNVKVWNNITDKVATDQGGNQETERTWDEQANRQNNLIDRNSFVDYNNNNFRLKSGGKAVDFGRVINGITNGYKGKAPDVGAYELGDTWKPGINWNPASGPAGLGCYGLPGEPCNTSDIPTDDRVDANLVNGVYFIQEISEKVRINSPSGRIVNTADTSNDSAKWEITKVNNYYTIKNLRNNEYLEVPYAACNKNDTSENPNINLGTYNSTAGNHQKWSITKFGEDYFLQPLHCEKVVDRNINGQPMHLWPYFKGNKNQNWRIVSAEEKCTVDTEISGVSISESKETSLTVVFDGVDGANTYELRAWPKGQFTGDINTPAATAYKSGNSPSLTVEGLQANTEYTLVLRAICSAGGTSKLIQVEGSTKGNDVLNFVNAPTTIEPATSYTFTINYEASTDREIVVAFWTATSWVAQSTAKVTKGKGETTVTVTLPAAPAEGKGYIYKAHIKPVGASWQQALDWDQVNNVTVEKTYQDKVAFVNPKTTIVQAKSYMFDVSYEASTDRDIIVEFWSATSWLGEKKVKVAKGKGTRPITVDLPNLPVAGTGYIYKLHIRPLNANWQAAIDRDQVNDVTVTSQRQACGANASISGVKFLGGTSSAITVAFDELTNSKTYELRAWPKGEFTGNINVPKAVSFKSSSSSPITISGLKPGTAYTLVLRGLCSTGGGTKLFQIEGTTAGNALKNVVEDVKNELDKFESAVSVYPNPLKSDHLTISLDDKKETSKVFVFDIQGKVLFQQQINGKSIDIERTNFGESGLYFIKVEQNEKSTIKKIIVQ